MLQRVLSTCQLLNVLTVLMGITLVVYIVIAVGTVSPTVQVVVWMGTHVLIV